MAWITQRTGTTKRFQGSMIDEIRAKNVALIKEAAITPAPGLSVITGETGSGKTAFLSALKLLVGARATTDLVREGADELQVQARIYAHNRGKKGSEKTANSEEPGAGREKTANSEKPEEELLVSRQLGRDGRSRVSINGNMEAVGALGDTVGPLVDLCGQHEHQKLLDTSQQLRLLDVWGKDEIAPVLLAYQRAFHEKRAAEAQLKKLQERQAVAQERLAQARYEIERIEEVHPSTEEMEELAAALPKAEHAGHLLEITSKAHAALAEEGAALEILRTAVKEISEAAALDTALEAVAQQLQAALAEVEDAAGQISTYAQDIDLDPRRLAAMQERQASLQSLMRTFGPTMPEVLERLRDAKAVLELAQNGEGALTSAQENLQEAEKTLHQAASALDKARRAVAPRFVQAVTQQMARLEMGTASLEMEVTPLAPDAWTEAGPSKIEFMYRPAQNLSSKPFKKVASGGEVSRVMLAIKVVAGAADEVETLVFDEVDAGVGGAVARALAQVLLDLSKTHQVICVTHLPQVAAVGQKHYLVTKEEGLHAIPETKLVEVSGKEREAEIARMLAGRVDELSLEHARALLAGNA